MSNEKTNNVHNFGQDKPESVARAVGVLKESTQVDSEPALLRPDRRLKPGKIAGAVGVLGVAAWALLPRPDQPPAPVPETFAEKVADSAQKPYNPDTDEIVIDGIRIKPNNPERNTPSEAVLHHPDVKAYVAAHPDESSAVTTSAMSLSSSKEGYALVERDVDSDGDNDTLAVLAK